MKTVIFANGDLNPGPSVDDVLVDETALFIAADGGARHMLSLGITPHVVIGDMDSLTSEQIEQCRAVGADILRYPSEKDETDLELALLYAKAQGATTIQIVGAMGDRLDQTMANILLMTLPALQDCDVALFAGRQKAWLMRPGHNAVSGIPDDTLSLIPLGGDATGITTTGLRYPLHEETLSFGPARGVSNVLDAQSADVFVKDGLLLAVFTQGRA